MEGGGGGGVFVGPIYHIQIICEGPTYFLMLLMAHRITPISSRKGWI